MEYSEDTIVEDARVKTFEGVAEEVDRHPIGFDSHNLTNISSIFWGMKTILAQGQFQLNFFFADPVIVKANSQVAVSITEVNDRDEPFLGQARMGIWNVVPQDDGTIFVRGNVDWPSRLRCLLNFIIVN